MLKTKNRTDLPTWVRNNIMMDCKYCGSPILDNSDTGVTTARKCSNPLCPGHMQYKVKFLADYFGIKGVGPATALDWILAVKPTTHLQILQKWFPNTKPKVALGDVAVLMCLEGYGATKANNQLNSYGSFTDFFERCPNPDIVLRDHKQELIDAEKYFDIRQPLSESKLFVMVTGTFTGYLNRDEFIAHLNEKYGQYVQIVNVGRRKTGVHFLIKEEGAVDHSKSQIAREYGIPIVTPQTFEHLVYEVATRLGYIDRTQIDNETIEEGGINIEDI